MQNLFISPEDEFIINFCVAMDKNNSIFCDLEKESLISSLESLGRDILDFSIEEYTATFKKPSFGDSSKLYGQIFSVSDNGINFNPMEIRYKKITSLIKTWNLKGKVEKPTEEDIMSLHPIIAITIGIVLDSEIGGIFE